MYKSIMKIRLIAKNGTGTYVCTGRYVRIKSFKGNRKILAILLKRSLPDRAESGFPSSPPGNHLLVQIACARRDFSDVEGIKVDCPGCSEVCV